MPSVHALHKMQKEKEKNTDRKKQIECQLQEGWEQIALAGSLAEAGW